MKRLLIAVLLSVFCFSSPAQGDKPTHTNLASAKIVGSLSETVPMAGAFDFKEELFGEPGTLSARVQSIDPGTGDVSINGVDTAHPSIPFDVDWGDGSPPEAVWFPFSHNYSDTGKNYVAALTSHYDDGGTDSVEFFVRFVAPDLNPNLSRYLYGACSGHEKQK